MTEKTEDLEIDIEDGAAVLEPEHKNGVVVAEAAKPPVVDGIETLKAQLAHEKSARQEAERRANEASGAATAAKKDVQDTNAQLVNNAIETVKQATGILKASFRDAMAAGDFDAAADVQAEMATNAAKLMRLEEGKAALEAAPKEPAKEVSRSQPIIDPVELLAGQLTPRSAAWVRAHPQFATDQRQYQRMLAAHNLAIGDGVEPDSDEYFSTVEQTLRIAPRVAVTIDDDPVSEAAKVAQTRSTPAAAPVTRSGNGTGGRNTVRLTAAEVEIAEMNGMTAEQYAVNKQKLKAEGRLN